MSPVTIKPVNVNMGIAVMNNKFIVIVSEQ